MGFLLQTVRLVGAVFVWLILAIALVWAFGALWFDFPIATLSHPVAILFVVISLTTFVLLRRRGAIAKLFVLAFVGLVAGWWFTLKPSNDQPWQPDVAETAWAETNGEQVTLHNVRNCDYRTETDYTPRWETRAIDLSKVTGADVAICYWGSPYLAHPIVSFQIADATPICFSIETRKRAGQSYSALAGLYRQFNLIYIVSDERDVIRLRTNYRHGEEIYLYRTTMSATQARQRLVEYLKTLNDLRTRPRWYNAITTNCTTAIRTQHPPNQRIPWDWRLLVNGKGDELLYERQLIVTAGIPFAELRKQSLINERALRANDSPEFSRVIRDGVPGFSHE